ncbi:uncharacterized protein LOC142235623 [Haematobia irritans]|uniref:uncharacterized protein LOC142235623 n=1 Tax=Haematobia irritans TaxID=7368 RepID=UPI003F50000B
MPASFLLMVNGIRRNSFSDTRIQRRRLRDVTNPMDIPNSCFVGLFRLNKEGFSLILDKISPYLGHGSIPAPIQVAAALRFFAVGSFQGVIANDMYLNIGRTTFCKILWKVVNAIEDHICPSWITMDMSSVEINASKLYFFQFNFVFFCKSSETSN